jgi:ABC-type Fe3+-siderophore transport system permease subunit
MTGLLISSDQEPDFTFWMLGSLGGATWVKVLLARPSPSGSRSSPP